MSKKPKTMSQPGQDDAAEQKVRAWLASNEALELFTLHLKRAAETADKLDKDMAVDPTSLSEVVTI